MATDTSHETLPPAAPYTLVEETVVIGDRRFVQRELSLEGESRLLDVIGRILEALNAAGIDVAVTELMKDGMPNLAVIAALVRKIGDQGALLLAEAAALLLGNFPTHEDGTVNDDFAPHVRYIARNLSTPRFFGEIVARFLEQNDYRRVVAPFERLWGEMFPPKPTETPTPGPTPVPSTPSSPPDTARKTTSTARTRGVSSPVS
jgi:hypothetical protein